MLPLLIIHGIIVVLFVTLGIVFLKGKGLFLIAGYNTASKAEKERTNEKKLCKYMGRMMFLFAGCFIIIMFSSIFDNMWILALGILLFFVIAIGGVIYMNTGNRLKK